jgi:hypothetical protein
MTRGITRTLTLFGALYAFYSLERSVARKNDGVGILHSIIERLDRKRAANEISSETYFAMIEDARQRTKEHYEFSQSPVYRTNYPEYVLRSHAYLRGANLANPYGLTAQDQAVRTKRTKSIWE